MERMFGSIPSPHNSTMPDILHEVLIDAPPAVVYDAISQERGLQAWWTRDCTVGSSVGSIAQFRFNGGRVTFSIRIDELDENERVVWYCLGADPEWQDTRIVYEIYEKHGMTAVDFRHLDWRSTEGIFAMCNYDWAKYLTSLKSYAETGQGQPHLG